MPSESKSKKLKAIAILARGSTQASTAEQVNVHYKTISRWLKEPDFANAVLETAQQELRQKLPQIYNVLEDKAIKGSHQHLKLLMDHLNRLEEIKSGLQQGQISFTWERKQ